MKTHDGHNEILIQDRSGLSAAVAFNLPSPLPSVRLTR